LEAAAGALLWFHPLVWLALHDVHVAREEACDETVADVTRAADTYLSALSKICRALLAPRVAGVSCMANSKLKERIHHIMRYDTLRTSALSHRGVVAIAAIALVALTTGSALIAANPPATGDPYKVTFSFTFDRDQYVFNAQVIDTATGRLVAHPRIESRVGTWGEATSGTTNPDRELRFRVIGQANREGVMQFGAQQDGREVQKTLMVQTPNEGAKGLYTGEPITINLKDAELQDVFKTFGRLAALEVVVDPGVTGKVTVDVHEMPWDEALDMIAKQNGLQVRVEGNKIYVEK
ncbi:MAG TPA: secretin and TonB N-terminal domain-containing protein, partial [Thermoanaerobaculia bacterium]|nr:secretin and TonB N-terminal domain-containing protein [Thermoanaerobaculia bacterium]